MNVVKDEVQETDIVSSLEAIKSSPSALEKSKQAGINVQQLSEVKIRLPLLPPVQEVTSRVRHYADSNFYEEYYAANNPLFDWTKNPPERIGIMDYTHAVGETGQTIYNIGTSHDRNPNSQQNVILRQRVLDYIANTSTEQRQFILEGLNMNLGVSLPQEFIDHFRQRADETEEEAYARTLQVLGEQGIAFFYALKNNIDVDPQSEATIEEEIQAMQEAGLQNGEIATYLLPKFLDRYKQGNEFTLEDILSEDQVSESLLRIISLTGWKREEFDRLFVTMNSEERKHFIASCITEINAIMRRETEKDIISLDYHPQFRFANEFGSYRDTSTLIDRAFQVSNDTRDYHITRQTYEAVQKGKSPFLMFGDSHTYKVDPALAHIASETRNA